MKRRDLIDICHKSYRPYRVTGGKFRHKDVAPEDTGHLQDEDKPRARYALAFGGTEINQDYLWRCVQHQPERSLIAIFNRSYCEEPLVPRVHKEALARQKKLRIGKEAR